MKKVVSCVVLKSVPLSKGIWPPCMRDINPAKSKENDWKKIYKANSAGNNNCKGPFDKYRRASFPYCGLLLDVSS